MALLDDIQYSDLAKKHPELAAWEERFTDYRLIYAGGEEFLRAAGQLRNGRGAATTSSGGVADYLLLGKRYRRFLYQLESEPDPKYMARLERAYYIGYLGAIIDFFRHWLFSTEPIIKPADGEDYPDWWAEFSANCNGGGNAFLDFIRDVWLDVLLVRRAGWLISGLDQERSVLIPYAAEEILDWQCNQSKELEWVLLRKFCYEREFPKERLMVEKYTFVDRNEWRTWEVDAREKGAEQVMLTGGGVHGLSRVPFAMTELPSGLWPANKLASWQIDIFNKMNMLSYGQLMSCFIQPYIKTNDENAQSRILGEGILLNLRAGGPNDNGEEFGYATPNTEPLQFTAAQLKDQRDEGYRIIHQMSLAVDSQAVGAIARSGASKIEDRKACEIILGGFGSYVKEPIVYTLNLLSEIYGDGNTWIVDGYDNFQVSGLDEELQNAALAMTFNIPSPTFKKNLFSKVANSMFAKEDESTKRDIAREIGEAVDMENEETLPPVGDDEEESTDVKSEPTDPETASSEQPEEE